VAKFKLISDPPLNGYAKKIGTVSVSAPKNMAVVSMALPLGGEKPAERAIKAAYGVALPAPGKSALSKDGKARLVRMSIDQAFVIFSSSTADAEPKVQAAIKGKAYTTDQTDAWTSLMVSGPNVRAALERICPVDLHPDQFAIHDCARTIMEHLGTLIIRVKDNEYLLMSASSSAGSFLHAIETSAKNVS